MSDLFGNHIVGFPTRRLIYDTPENITDTIIYSALNVNENDVLAQTNL